MPLTGELGKGRVVVYSSRRNLPGLMPREVWCRAWALFKFTSGICKGIDYFVD